MHLSRQELASLTHKESSREITTKASWPDSISLVSEVIILLTQHIYFCWITYSQQVNF